MGSGVRVREFHHASGLTQRLAAVDLMEGGVEVLASMLRGPVAVLYSDPPWTPANEKYWRTMAKLPPSRGYLSLLDAWCRAAVLCRPQHLLVEHSALPDSKQYLLDAIGRCEGWTLPFVEEWEVLYGSPRRPNALLHYGPVPLPTNPSGIYGEPMTRRVFEGLAQLGLLGAGRTVVDPCTGLGMTSRMAHAFGCNFVGTELNPKRLERTVSWLLKRGYSEVAPSMRAEGEAGT